MAAKTKSFGQKRNRPQPDFPLSNKAPAGRHTVTDCAFGLVIGRGWTEFVLTRVYIV